MAGLVALSLPASGHDVFDVTADCNEAVVHFSGFEQPVLTHNVVTVGNVGSVTRDVTISGQTSETHIDITSLTSQLHGATADVDVDSTWTFQGPQHFHFTRTVTCGNHETSTVEESSTMQSTSTTASTIEGSSTSSSSSTTSSSVGNHTSTSVRGVNTTVVSVSPTEVTAAPGGGSNATVAAAAAAQTLPFTGSAGVPLLIFGFSLVAGGAAFLLANRRRNPHVME